MYKFSWCKNRGYFSPESAKKVKKAKCGICGMKMNVERNVLCSANLIEAMAGYKSLRDRFTCPNLNKSWHRTIVALVHEAYSDFIYYC